VNSKMSYRIEHPTSVSLIFPGVQKKPGDSTCLCAWAVRDLQHKEIRERTE
jgi:hypothetical protein